MIKEIIRLQQMTMEQNSFKKGLIDGIPICLGYLSVSFTFGMACINGGMPLWTAVLISMTCLTSAGQFAGLSIMLASGGLIEMALTQLVINLRYSLMSLSLSQKLGTSIKLLDRFAIAFFNTDEIFAVASGNKGNVGKKYMYGLAVTPYFGWAVGTFLGGAVSSLLPESISSALGIAIYGMFLAIIIPPAKKKLSVLIVVLISVVLSSIFYYVPFLSFISSGFSIIICAVAAAAIGAILFPVEESEGA